MITVSIAGGSQPEILQLVKKALKEAEQPLQFIVFDTNENLDTENLWKYVHCSNEAAVAQEAVSLVATGQAQILLKGIIQTHTLLKEMLKSEHQLKNKPILSHVAMVELPAGKTFLLTDCAMNIAPTQATLIEIVENAKEVAQKLGLHHPKIALLSAAENFNPKIPSSVLAKEVTAHFNNQQEATVFGPLSLDLATSEEAVAHKRYSGPIMGDADILVVPTIDVGNCLYKSLTLFGHAKVGGTIVGTKVPVVLTSRSDSTESKFHSTKLALFANHDCLAEETLRHSVQELAPFENVVSQTPFRKQMIAEFLETHNITQLAAVVGRGGLLKPIPGGTYLVDQQMLEDLRTERFNTHASNLGAILANEFAEKYHVPAFIVDPVVVDELQPLARISGLKGIHRRSVGHALNQKAVARKIAEDLGKTYEQSNFIVVHLGGGISLGAHQKGRMVDVVNGLDGEGPYTPERSGALPLVEFAQWILEQELTISQVKKLIAGNSGLKSYLGETDLRHIQAQIAAGDQTANYYLKGMCYQIAKSIGEMAVVLEGAIDAIILTGGAAYSQTVVQEISQKITWIAPIKVYPGEMEMAALYEGVNRVLTGEEQALNYSEAKIEQE